VNQTLRDCLEEAMDVESLAAILERLHSGDIRSVTRDTPEPSLLAHEILTARPYAFLDDAPLEERRTQAVHARRTSQFFGGGELGALDPAAIAQVRLEQAPDPRDPDELHDALMTAGVLLEAEARAAGADLIDRLARAGRASRATLGPRWWWVAAERVPEMVAVHQNALLEPAIAAPTGRTAREWTRDAALAEIVRGRLTLVGPITATALAASLAVPEPDVRGALLELESEGSVLRGSFTGTGGELEWCDRALLARIHRYTLNRLRAEIEPVSPADLMRFLFAWQHAAPSARLTGVEGLRQVVGVLDGWAAPLRAWERTILPLRLDRYEPSMLDSLCLTGEAGWALNGTSVVVFLREHGWPRVDEGARPAPDPAGPATVVLEILRGQGASFFRDLVAASGLEARAVLASILELARVGLVASDAFAGVRALDRAARGRWERVDREMAAAGRWSLAGSWVETNQERAVERQAWMLLRRYGIVCRRLLTREADLAPWRELTRVYRRLEARGEIRGGRFAAGMTGEQFALKEAVERLREIRRGGPDGRLVVIGAADPLNLAGIVTSGDRVRAVASTWIAYRDGVPVAALEGDYVTPLIDPGRPLAADVVTALSGRARPQVAAGYVGRAAHWPAR
jgi:ATP-dependent Lhr-like helicase